MCNNANCYARSINNRLTVVVVVQIQIQIQIQIQSTVYVLQFFHDEGSLSIYNIVESSDSGNSTLLVSLDLSAAFDGIDHAMLLSRLKTSFGFDELVYHWIESYLTDCSQTVTIRNNSSAPIPMLPLVFPKVLFSVLFFSAFTPSLLLRLLPLPLFLSSNKLMTHNFTFILPISSVKSVVLKIVSLPCTPVTVITSFPLILINRTQFSAEPGNALILCLTSPRSTLRARLFQWRTTSGYSVSHSTIA